MAVNAILPAVLSGVSIAAVVLLGVWRTLAHYERRNDKAHGELGDAITSAETRLGQRIDRLDEQFDDERAQRKTTFVGQAHGRQRHHVQIVNQTVPAALRRASATTLSRSGASSSTSTRTTRSRRPRT